MRVSWRSHCVTGWPPDKKDESRYGVFDLMRGFVLFIRHTETDWPGVSSRFWVSYVILSPNRTYFYNVPRTSWTILLVLIFRSKGSVQVQSHEAKTDKWGCVQDRELCSPKEETHSVSWTHLADEVWKGCRSGLNHQLLRAFHEHHQNHHEWVFSLVVSVVSVLSLLFREHPFPSPSPPGEEKDNRLLNPNCNKWHFHWLLKHTQKSIIQL